MAIKVKHDGGDLGGLAALAALAGSAQREAPAVTQQVQLPSGAGSIRGSRSGGYIPSSKDRLMALNAAASRTKQEIKGRAEAQVQAADDAMKRTAVASGLQREMKEQEYDMEVEKIREAAKIEAEQFETRYTAQSRQKIQQGNNALQAIAEDEGLDDEGKAAMSTKVRLWMQGIQPSQIPADSNKIKYIEGREPGRVWPGEEGGWFSTEPDGSVKLLVRPDQTTKYMQEKAKIETEAAERAERKAAVDARLSQRAKVATTMIDVPGGIEGESTKRFMDLGEIDAIMDKIHPESVVQGPWWENAERQGMTIMQSDKDLPPQVGFCQAYLRQFPDPLSVPKDKKAAYNEAHRIYSAYVQQLQ